MSQESEPSDDPDAPPATPEGAQPTSTQSARWTRPKSRNASIPIILWIPLTDRSSQQPDTWRRSGQEPLTRRSLLSAACQTL